MSVVINPEKDITAFELAHLIAATGTFRKKEDIRFYLKEKCPSALRHLPDFKEENA